MNFTCYRNTHINWTTGVILGWSPTCHQVCLEQATVSQSSTCSSSAPDMSGVPAEYLDFREVFSKAKATSLPPHRPCDCAISSLVLLHPEAAYTPFPPLREGPWTPTLTTLWPQASSDPRHLRQGRASSLWQKRTRRSALVSTIED